MSHERHAHDAGPYVLGALTPPERRDFEEHLRDCPACERTVGDLAGMPGLLARVPRSAWEHAPDRPEAALPDTLLPRLLAEVRRSRRRRTVRVAGAVAAALVVLTGGVAAWQLGPAGTPDPPGGSPPPVTAPEPGTPMRQVGQDTVSARLAMEQVPWGTRLDLTCSYDAPAGGYGAAPPPSYSLVVRTTDGRTEQVATWQAVPGRTVTVTGATATPADAIGEVEVRDAQGRALLELDRADG